MRSHRLVVAALLLHAYHVLAFDEFFGRAGNGGPRASPGRDTEYYDTLGLSPGCSEADIKRAYRKRALQEHPDKGGDPEKFKKINEAYAVLSDEQKRAAYDRFGKAAVDGSSGAGMAGGGFPGGMGGAFPGAFGGAFGNAFGGAGGVSPEDIFAQFFGGMGQPQQQRRRQRPRMPDQQMTMPVSLEEIHSGITKRVGIRRPVVGGDGLVRQERVDVDIKLEAGTPDGQRFRIPAGSPHRANVYVQLRQKPHPRFARHGADLVASCEISLLEALTGFKTSFRHLDGRMLTLSCDGEVTRPGQLKRLRGYGMPRHRAGGKGDLFLRMAVMFPREPLTADASRSLQHVLPRRAGTTPPLEPGAKVLRLERVEEEEAAGLAANEDDSGAGAEWAF